MAGYVKHHDPAYARFRDELERMKDLRLITVQAVLTWVDLPGIARYRQEFAVLAPERRIRLEFPSPYLRNEPTLLAVEGGRAGTTRSWVTRETASYQEAFELELIEFHAAVERGASPHREAWMG